MRISQQVRKTFTSSFLAIAAVMAGQAHAAESAVENGGDAAVPGVQGGPTDAAQNNGQLGEIVVSAERTNTTLQKANLAVTAVTADLLRQNNITEIGGLNGSVPGLVVASGNGGERNIAIRGIGLGTPENPATQSGVSYHIDGVYIFNSIAANAAFSDVSQIEVLRGPQGTMYGQGSTGGTINVVSTQPTTDKLSGYVDAGYGNYNYVTTNAALNVPITDTLAARGAIQFMKHDGYAKATDVAGQPGYPLSDANTISGKASIKWTPGTVFSLLLSTIQYRGDANGAEQKNVLDPNPDPRKVTQDFPGTSYVRTQLYYGVAKLDFDGLVATSITSYQKLLSRQGWDGDGLNQALFLQYQGANTGGAAYDHIALWQQQAKSWTQEVNLAYDKGGRFKGIIGGVYLHSRNSSYINEYSAATGDGLNAPLAMHTAYDDPLISALQYAELSSITRDSFAFYGQGTYKLTDRLSITAGLRYNRDKYVGESDSISGGRSSQTSGVYLQPSSSGPANISDALTWKAAVNYDITPVNMVYVSYTRGYKPGGVNTNAGRFGSFISMGNPYGVQGNFNKETVDSFEIGSKNRFFGNRLQFNAAAFYYLYKNMQFINDDPILYSYGIGNVPMAHIYGGEFEADWRATEHLRLDGNLSLQHGSFTDDFQALNPITATAAQAAAGFAGTGGFYGNYYAAYLSRAAAYQNVKGNAVPNMPTVQGSGAISWTGQAGPGKLMLRAQYLYRGGFQSNVFQSAWYDKTPHYSQVNLFANYDFVGTGFSVSATVTNLFNVDGISSRFTDPYGTHQVFSTYIPPRQALVSVKYAF